MRRTLMSRVGGGKNKWRKGKRRKDWKEEEDQKEEEKDWMTRGLTRIGGVNEWRKGKRKKDRKEEKEKREGKEKRNWRTRKHRQRLEEE